jgi:hypothetical protein
MSVLAVCDEPRAGQVEKRPIDKILHPRFNTASLDSTLTPKSWQSKTFHCEGTANTTTSIDILPNTNNTLVDPTSKSHITTTQPPSSLPDHHLDYDAVPPRTFLPQAPSCGVRYSPRPQAFKVPRLGKFVLRCTSRHRCRKNSPSS